MCDAHGFQLGLATLPGAVHTFVHNGCSFELWRMMREAGVYCEVEPRHLFNTLLPAAYLLQPGPRPNYGGSYPRGWFDLSVISADET